MRIVTWNINSQRVRLPQVLEWLARTPVDLLAMQETKFAFRRNHGLRIDLVLASEALAARCNGCHIHREPRRAERPSDHAPVVAEFELPHEDSVRLRGWRPRKCAPRRGSGAAGLPRLAGKSPRVPFRGGARAPRPSLLTSK